MTDESTIDYQVGLIKKGNAYYPYNEMMAQEMNEKYKDGDIIVFTDLELQKSDQATWQQIKSVYLYLDKIAKRLFGGGIDMLTIFDKMSKKSGFKVMVTKERLKRDVWNEMQKALYGTESLKKIKKSGVSDVYMHVDGFFQREFDVSEPFPDRYSQSLDCHDS